MQRRETLNCDRFVGYVAAVGCVGLYLIATYLFRLQNKQHIRYLKQWSVHVLAAIFDVGKLLVISCVEFVLIGNTGLDKI